MTALISLAMTLAAVAVGSNSELQQATLPHGGLWFANHVRSERSSDAKSLLMDEPSCQEDIKRLCGGIPPGTDDLAVLECIQTYKVNYFSPLEILFCQFLNDKIIGLKSNFFIYYISIFSLMMVLR
jgi:hypothetical protein